MKKPIESDFFEYHGSGHKYQDVGSYESYIVALEQYAEYVEQRNNCLQSENASLIKSAAYREGQIESLKNKQNKHEEEAKEIRGQFWKMSDAYHKKENELFEFQVNSITNSKEGEKFKDVIEACTKYKDWVKTDYIEGSCDKYEFPIVKAAMTVVFGSDFWNWYDETIEKTQQ